MDFDRSVSVLVPIFTVLAISGCSQVGPSDELAKKSLQDIVPSYWSIESISFENKENIGTQADPRIQSRFKSTLKLKKDTFDYDDKKDLKKLNPKYLSNLSFILPAQKKGKTVEMYGVALSKKYRDSWLTEFKPDNDPTLGQGKSRESFGHKTVLSNSPEEVALQVESDKQNAADRKDAINKLLSRESYGLIREENSIYGNDIKIKFTSGNADSSKVEGQILSVLSSRGDFTGTLSSTELKLTVNKVVKGKGALGVGTILTIPLENINLRTPMIEGTWTNPDGKKGIVQIAEY